MDAALLSAVASIGTAFAIIGGFVLTLYRARHSQTRSTGHQLTNELERLNNLLKDEIRRRDEQIAAQRSEVEYLKQKNATFLQALAAVYRQPPEVIDWRLNGGPTPPGMTRH